MKIGVIIIFNNDKLLADSDFLIGQIKQLDAVELCFVDNNTKDNTLYLLEEIKDECQQNVSVIQIKKNISLDGAMRAGARYMVNEFNLKHIGFINVNDLVKEDLKLNNVLQSISNNNKSIINYNIKSIENQSMKKTLFKSVFSLIEYLKQININNSNLNASSL
jgi:GT2 family glycosyltransferase